MATLNRGSARLTVSEETRPVNAVRPAAGASVWHHVFLADLTQPATPHITTAEQAIVVAGDAADGDA